MVLVRALPNEGSSVQPYLEDALRLLQRCATDFSTVQRNPRLVKLRNPELPREGYARWSQDHKFGSQTFPSALDDAWPPSFSTLVGLDVCRPPDDRLVCTSICILHYLPDAKTSRVTYHKDPVHHEYITAITLKGHGTLKLRQGTQKAVHYEMNEGSVVSMEQEDCWYARHAVDCPNGRLALILRYSDASRLR